MTNPTESMEEALRPVLRFAETIAERHGYELNPDPAHLERLARHLTENKASHGRLYCPCKQSYPLRPDVDPVCPCDDFHDEIEKQGHCECHLFFSPETADRLRRRPGLLATVTCPG